MKVNIAKYWERLWAEDLFAAIILEEDFDLDENGAPRVDCTNWEQDFRAELTGYIAAHKCGEERKEDYKRALSILDEMEQDAAEQTQTSAPETVKCANLYTAAFEDGTLMTGTLDQLYAAQNNRRMTIKPVVWLWRNDGGRYMVDYILEGVGRTLGVFDVLSDAETARNVFNVQPAADIARMLHAETVKCFSCPMHLEALGSNGKRYPAEYDPKYKTIFFAIPAKVNVLGYIPTEEG